MEKLKTEIQRTVVSACGGDGLFDVSRRAGEGMTNERPRLLVISFYILSEPMLKTMRLYFREHTVVYWPLYCASGPYRPKVSERLKVSSLRLKSAESGLGVDPLPWKDWLYRAIRIIQPRDIMMIGHFSNLTDLPKRPSADHALRGRVYVPFVFDNLPRRGDNQTDPKATEDYEKYVERWSMAFREHWFGKIIPHFDNIYFLDVPTIPETGLVNAFAILTRKRKAEAKSGKKEIKLPKVE